jgi:hypothetical protein
MAFNPMVPFRFMGTQVVHNHMDFLIRIFRNDFVHKIQKLPATTAVIMARLHLSRSHVQGCKQGTGSMPSVLVVSSCQRFTMRQLKASLSSLQCLNGWFFIHTYYQSILRKIRRMRTLTIGLLTPFYFIRAGTLVSLAALVSAPLVFFLLLMGKVLSKIFGLYPFIGIFRQERNERWYYTLMMSTGLTFGTISALYGFSHGIVTQNQYLFLVSTVIASAVVPTLIAGLYFLPKHLLPQPDKQGVAEMQENGLSEEG